MAMNLLANMASTKKINAEDVLRLRREVFQDGLVSRAEAEITFRAGRFAWHEMPGMDVVLSGSPHGLRPLPGAA